jgi:hypothetical protein
MSKRASLSLVVVGIFVFGAALVLGLAVLASQNGRSKQGDAVVEDLSTWVLRKVKTTELTSTIERIAVYPADPSGLTYQFMLEDDRRHFFLVHFSKYNQLSLVRDGDRVEIAYVTYERYDGVAEEERTIKVYSFSCVSHKREDEFKSVSLSTSK